MRERPPDLFYVRFRALLAEAERRGDSIADVADAIGVHQSRLYRWRDEIDGPSGSSLAALADYVGWTMDYLWGMTDEPQPEEVRLVPPDGGPDLDLGDLGDRGEPGDEDERAAQ